MSRFRLLVPFLAALAILIAGCAKPEAKFVGNWVGKQQLDQKTLDAINNAAKTPQERAAIQARQNMQMNLSLNKDKTATMGMTGSNATLNGNWSYEGNQVSVMFGSGGEPMKLDPSPDGKTLILNGAATGMGQNNAIVFTKS